MLLRDIRSYLRLQLQDPVLRTDNQHYFMTTVERHTKVRLLSQPGVIQPLTNIHPQDTSIQHRHHRPHLHMQPIHRPDTGLRTMAERPRPHHRSNLSSSSSSKWW